MSTASWLSNLQGLERYASIMQQAARRSRASARHASTSSTYNGYVPPTFHRRRRPNVKAVPNFRSTVSSRWAPPETSMSAPRNRTFARRISKTPDISSPTTGFTDQTPIKSHLVNQPKVSSANPTLVTLRSASACTPSKRSTPSAIPCRIAGAATLPSSQPRAQHPASLTSTHLPKNLRQYSARSSADPPVGFANGGYPFKSSSRGASRSSFAFNKSKAILTKPDSKNIMWAAQSWGDKDAPSRKSLARRRRQLMQAYLRGIAMARDVAAQDDEETDRSAYATAVDSGEAYLLDKFGSNWRRLEKSRDVWS